MQIELTPGLTNVIRFPVEERVDPSIPLLFEIEPDVREVLAIEESFQLEGIDEGLFEASDRETATYIAEQILPTAGGARLRSLLDELLSPIVADAVTACRQAHAASTRAVEAEQKALTAKVAGSRWVALLEAEATSRTEQAARLLIAAHNACRRAHGVNRAVWFAREGEKWRPYDIGEETERVLLGIRPAA